MLASKYAMNKEDYCSKNREKIYKLYRRQQSIKKIVKNFMLEYLLSMLGIMRTKNQQQNLNMT